MGGPERQKEKEEEGGCKRQGVGKEKARGRIRVFLARLLDLAS